MSPEPPIHLALFLRGFVPSLAVLGGLWLWYLKRRSGLPIFLLVLVIIGSIAAAVAGQLSNNTPLYNMAVGSIAPFLISAMLFIAFSADAGRELNDEHPW